MSTMAARIKIFDLRKKLMMRGLNISEFARKHDIKEKTVQKVISRYWASEASPRPGSLGSEILAKLEAEIANCANGVDEADGSGRELAANG